MTTPPPTTEDRSASSETSVENPPTAAEEFLDIVRTVAIAVGVTLLVRFFLFQPFNIPSGSMKPTLLVGDFVIVDKMSYGYSRASLIWPLTRMDMDGRLFGDTPERGDVAVFKNAGDRNRDYIKRVIGLPGDEIAVIDGVLRINGKSVGREELSYLEPLCGAPGRGAPPNSGVYLETLPDGGPSYIVQECRGEYGPFDDYGPVTIPEASYLMMGDNRDNSSDSRDPSVGVIPYDQLVGRATRVAFSIDGEEASFLEPWNWPFAIRYDRFAQRVR